MKFQNRNNLITINTISFLGSRFVTILISLITLPLTLNYLGAERFGMMETIVSLIAILNFADLGIGFGLQNNVIKLKNTGDSGDINKAISSILLVLISTSLIFIFVFSIFYSKIHWNILFNVKSNLAIYEVNKSVLIFFICFIIQIPFSIVQKIQIGLQQGYISEFWKISGNVAGIFTLFIVIYFKLGVPFVILAIYGNSTLFIILNFIFYFKKNKRYSLNIFLFDKILFLKLYKEGLIFFILQIFYIFLISSDRIILSYLIGPSVIVVYSIGFRLATLFATPVDAFTLQLLPAFNDAIQKNDLGWYKSYFKKSLKNILIISLISCFLLITFGNALIKVWIGNSHELDFSVLFAFGIYVIYTNFNSLLSYTLLTPIFISKVLPIYTISVILSILIKVKYGFYFGTVGVVWSTILVMTIFYLAPSLSKILKYNKI